MARDGDALWEQMRDPEGAGDGVGYGYGYGRSSTR